MATSQTAADEIRLRMAEIRSNMNRDMREVVHEATAATDWRSPIRKHPWLAIGIAFTSGFLIVPRRSRPVQLTVTTSPAEATNLAFASKPEKPKRLPLIRWMMGVIGPIGIRAAQSYALNYIEHFLVSNQPGAEPTQPARPGPPSQAPRAQAQGSARDA